MTSRKEQILAQRFHAEQIPILENHRDVLKARLERSGGIRNRHETESLRLKLKEARRLLSKLYAERSRDRQRD